MSGLLGSSPLVFFCLTIVIAGAAAMLAGGAIARNWKPPIQVVGTAFGLALADRFLKYALFQEPFLSLSGLIAAFVVLLALGLLAWRSAKAATMVRQYPWLYERVSPFSWKEKGAAGRG